ncbi:MAG: terminase [Myxococcales bacterium]
MRPHLISWQWEQYPQGHRSRYNLLVHAATVPLFIGGVVATAASPWMGAQLLLGAALLPVAMAVQGRGHRREAVPPVPFAGPVDVVLRIFAEQLITFPRFVLSGGFASAWRQAGR